MSGPEVFAWAVVAGAGLAGSFVCSGLETGFYGLNRIRLDVRAARLPPDRAARLLKSDVEHSDRTVTTILLGNNAFGYLSALGATALLEVAGYRGGELVAVNIAILTPLMLVFCEALPKELFRLEADRLTYRLAPALWMLRKLFTLAGVLPVVLWIARAAARLASRRIAPAEESALPAEPRRRIEMLLKEGAAQGTLSASQATLVERALAMRGATVADQMVPWSRVQGLPLELDRPRLLAFLAQQPHGNFPVVDRRGWVVGILWQPSVYLEPRRPISELLREPARLAPGIHLLDALSLVRASPARVGIVERHGRPIGLVTEKDLVQPLTGEI